MAESWHPLINLIRAANKRARGESLIDARHDPSKYGQTTFPGATKATAGLVDHGDLNGLSDDDHTQYVLVAGTRAMTGHLPLTEIAAPGSPPASGIHYLYPDSTSHRLNDMDPDGSVHDLTKQNVVTIQGQAPADGATSQRWDSDQTQTDACAVSSAAVFAYDFTNHKQTSGYGLWSWVARRNQSEANFAQAVIAVGGQMDYNGCDVLKLRAKVKVQGNAASGSAPSGGSYWDSVYAYVTENSGDNDTKSADLQSQLSDGNYRIIEADFDVSGWSIGAEEALFFGLEFKGVDVDDPDPDPLNEWEYAVSIEWIEVIAWIN